MKKISALLICVLAAAMIFCACGKKNSEPEIKENDPAVVGTWAEDFFDSGYVFNNDSTGMDTFWNLSFTYTAYDGVITITYDSDMYGIAAYDYTISGDVLSMIRQDDRTDAFEYKKQAASSRPTTAATQATSGDEEGEENTEADGEENTDEETTTTEG